MKNEMRGEVTYLFVAVVVVFTACLKNQKPEEEKKQVKCHTIKQIRAQEQDFFYCAVANEGVSIPTCAKFQEIRLNS